METVQINDLVFVVAPEVKVAPTSDSLASSNRPRKRVCVRRPLSQSKLILAVAKRHGWENVRVVGRGEMIDEPIETSDWRVIPMDQYEGIIPVEAIQQIEILAETGIYPKGFLIADDLRHTGQKTERIFRPKIKQTIHWELILNVLGKLATVALIGTAVVTLLPLVLGAGAIAVGIAYDPLLIAVTEENEWVCLFEWWE